MPFTSNQGGEGRKKAIFKEEKETKENVINEKEVEAFEEIETELLAGLGIPPTLLRVETRSVGTSHYRTNVLCSIFEDDHILPTITRPHCYYVTQKEDGTYTFEPKVERQYKYNE
jgi:hypothetical protein